MSRLAAIILALFSAASLSETRLFTWDARQSWPAGTTIELSANGITQTGISGTQYTLDIPLGETRKIDAKARAVGVNGDVSDWATYATVVPELQSAPTRAVILEGIDLPSPSPWTDIDIGAVIFAGDSSYSNGTYTVTGGGLDIWTTADAFHFTYQSLNGDGEIIARVVTMPSADFYTKVGVMFRETTDVGSKNVFCVNVFGQGARMQTRSATNGLTTAPAPGTNAGIPRWLKLTRAGDLFTAYQSADGSNWAQISTSTVSMNASLLVGLAITSHNTSTTRTATLDNVSINKAGGVTSASVSTSIGALIKKAGINASLSIGALLQRSLSNAVSTDALIRAVSTGKISLDSVLQAVNEQPVAIDALIKAGGISAATIDALIKASKASDTAIDAVIRAASSLQQTGLDSILHRHVLQAANIDALLAEKKSGNILIDGLLQAHGQSGITLDTVILSAFSGVIGFDALLQLSPTIYLSVDALLSGARNGDISLDAVIRLAAFAATGIDAKLMAEVLNAFYLDAIIGKVMRETTNRLVLVGASDRFISVAASDRVVSVSL